MEKKDGCCKEEAKQIKIATDQKSFSNFSNFIFKSFEADPIAHFKYDDQHILNLTNDLNSQPFSTGPPAKRYSIYKYLGVFRI